MSSRSPNILNQHLSQAVFRILRILTNWDPIFRLHQTIAQAALIITTMEDVPHKKPPSRWFQLYCHPYSTGCYQHENRRTRGGMSRLVWGRGNRWVLACRLGGLVVIRKVEIRPFLANFQNNRHAACLFRQSSGVKMRSLCWNTSWAICIFANAASICHRSCMSRLIRY